MPPAKFRGVLTTGVDGNSLLGPVQPDGDAIRIVEPWPQRVLATAEEIAETTLPGRYRDAIWRAVEPERADVILVAPIEVAVR